MSSFGLVPQIQISVVFSVNSNSTAPNYPPAPYSLTQLSNCSSSGVMTNNYGGSSLSFPFGSYSAFSPLRPLCETFAINATSQVVGEFQIAANIPGNASVSGYVHLGSTTVFPTGFTPITFTSNGSVNGTVVSAIIISGNDSGMVFNITTPQISFPPDIGLRSAPDLLIMQYDTSSGSMVQIPVTSFTQSGTSSLWMMKATLPTAGLYIFGMINHSVIAVLPTAFGNWFSYSSVWGQTTVSYDSGNLHINISSSNDIQLFAYKVPALTAWSPDGYFVQYSVYLAFDKVISGTNVTLIYNSSSVTSKSSWG